ncbi:hypothetical protein AQJ30_04185 [Streptomyces longwoodensis]|uniref:eCIS core domain-containing protein n=1 Tax=Streptomyces longwoodensis TaxID=68231 RepID=A0A101R3N8_9ACTN|nr:DUF4157 domain-containing protein [Streptomyces longwoodensis]KUN41089.1 hypothetical protein AQJ30_04185 [Streptomyces longwoodensis]
MHADRQRHAADPDRGRGLPQRVVRPPESAGPQQAAARLAGGLSPATALSLQRTIGNAAVARLVDRERHQHSADCGHGATVQRSADDQSVQRDALDRVDAVTRASGSPLRTDVRRRMESDYGGEDFSDVRVHVDRSSAEAVGAKAYTTRTHHIVFRSAADMDDHTMRHELQHVRQQRAGAVPSGISDPGDAWERDAESTATRLGQRPAGVQRSVAPELNHTSAQGVAVQRMPSRGSDRAAGRGRRGSDCRIEGIDGEFRVTVVSRPSSPAHSSHDETGPTINNFANRYSNIGAQANVLYDRSVVQFVGGSDETDSAINNYDNERRNIGHQGHAEHRATVTQDVRSGSRGQRRERRGSTAPVTNNFENQYSNIGIQAGRIQHHGAVVRFRGDRFTSHQGSVSRPGGLHTRNFSGSTLDNRGTGSLSAANFFDASGRRPADDPGRRQEPNYEFNSPMENSHGRRQAHGNYFDAGPGAVIFHSEDTDEEVIGSDRGVTVGSDFHSGGQDLSIPSRGGVYNANYFRGREFVGDTFHLSSGVEESFGGGATRAPIVPRDEFRAQEPTVLEFEGVFRVVGDASLFLGNLFVGGSYRAWSRQQESRTEGGFPDPTREDLYIGNTFRIRRGTIILSGGVYFYNSFSADRIIIRDNAVFVGGNTFHGEVEVENPDQVAQEIYVGTFTNARADRVTRR